MGGLVAFQEQLSLVCVEEHGGAHGARAYREGGSDFQAVVLVDVCLLVR